MSERIEGQNTSTELEVPPLSEMQKSAFIQRDANSDWFIGNMVEWVKGSDIEFAITLQVGGLLVTGFLVSGHRYFDHFADDFSSAFEDADARESIRSDIAKNGDIYRQQKDEQPTDEPYIGPAFIHLRDARYVLPGSPMVPNNQGIWWRGRIAAVDGFHMSLLVPSPAS